MSRGRPRRRLAGVIVAVPVSDDAVATLVVLVDEVPDDGMDVLGVVRLVLPGVAVVRDACDGGMCEGDWRGGCIGMLEPEFTLLDEP
jgi:hypothetical protein